MGRRVKQAMVHLLHDESGQVVVFVCVFMVALLVFALSVVNIGHITNEKIHLQNAADFSALSAATWQARAMNMEGLLNTTVSASIVLEVARSLVTGVPPREMPPDWIKLQQAAQDWIQQSFNSFTYTDDPAAERQGFGSWVAYLAAQANGGFDVITDPPRVPLYVYRYRFFDAQHEVNPAVGAEHFVETAEQRGYVPPVAGQTNPYYTAGALALAQEVPEAPGGQGYVFWEHTDPLGKEEDIIWPSSGDPVKVYSGGPDALGDTQLRYNLLKELGENRNLTPEEQERVELLESLKAAIYRLIDEIVAENDISELREKADASLEIADILKEYVEQNLKTDPVGEDFQKLFQYDGSTSNGGELDLVFEDGLKYKQNESRHPKESTPDDPVVGHLVVRIFPKVRVGVFPEKAGVELIDGDYSSNQASSGTWILGEFRYQKDRWYDTQARKEFWNLRTTVFSNADIERIDSSRREVYHYEYIGVGDSRRRIKVFDYYEYQWRVTCPICGQTGRTVHIRENRRPTAAQRLQAVGPTHQSHSDLSDPHHRGDCVRRCWWYYRFGVEFEVTIKAYMNLDFSTILMARYTATTDLEHNRRPGNEYLNMFEDVSTNGTALQCTCIRPAQSLTFGQSLLRMKPEEVPQDLAEHAGELSAGTVPAMTAVSAAEHAQGVGSVGTESTAGDLFFGMDWHSAMTNSIGTDAEQ